MRGFPGISLIMVVHNEEARIHSALAAITPYVDEIVVCDQESTDRTRELIGTFADIVLTDACHGFGESSRFLCEMQASCQWILVLDADERLHPSVCEALPDLIADERYGGYMFALDNWVGDYEDVTDATPFRLYRRGMARHGRTLHSGTVPVNDTVKVRVLNPGIIHHKTWYEHAVDSIRYGRLEGLPEKEIWQELQDRVVNRAGNQMWAQTCQQLERNRIVPEK